MRDVSNKNDSKQKDGRLFIRYNELEAQRWERMLKSCNHR